MPTSCKKKLFLVVFCLSSITQGMYSTYFVSILTTIERIYQIQSKTAGAILSATEIGQILGSLFISYYGGRGNKPKWISMCMTISALAALISISPHLLLVANNDRAVHNHIMTNNSVNELRYPITPSPYLPSDLSARLASPMKNTTLTKFKLDLPSYDHLCRTGNYTALQVTSQSPKFQLTDINPPITDSAYEQRFPVSIIIALFFTCLLAIGFGSTAITTLGIPFMDDIISKEESPLYLGLTIGLRIFGPALGFLLGSFCIRIDSNSLFASHRLDDELNTENLHGDGFGAWWLGLIIISLPLLFLAVPMFCLSRTITSNDSEKDDYEDITYQAAEDHDIGDSHDFPAHMMGLTGNLDITSNLTCFSSEVDTSSSREVLQACQSSPGQYSRHDNYNRNITFDQPILSSESKGKLNFISSHELDNQTIASPSGSMESTNSEWRTQNVCLVMKHFGGLESTNFTNNEVKYALEDCQQNPSRLPLPSSSRSSVVSTMCSYTTKDNCRMQQQQQPQQQDVLAISNLSSSLSRLLKNRLLVLRMLSAVLHILPIAGFYTFLPKYLIEQFRITSSSASAISGLAGILFVGFGAFLGGTIIRLFNVNSRLMTRWIASSALIYTLGMLILMNLGCENNQIVHLDSADFQSTDCSALCGCSPAIYSPVCANGTTYIFPCLAGCKGYTITEDRIIFDECGCSLTSSTERQSINGSATSSNTHVNLNVATQGQCSIKCDNLLWALALGLITFTSSLLGTIPCSIIYGSIVDYTCVHWDYLSPLKVDPTTTTPPLQESRRGACRAYENDEFRHYLHGLTALVMFLAFIVDIIISTRANEVDFYDGKDDSRTDIRMGLKKSTESI